MLMLSIYKNSNQTQTITNKSKMYTEKKMSKMLLSLASLMVLVAVSAAQAQPPLPPGLEQEVRACLAGGVGVCAPYAESTTTTPPAACCDRLESLIVNNVSCVCLLFRNEDVVQALQLDVAKALTLPPRCGLPPFDLSDNCPASMAPARAPLMSTPNAPVSVPPAQRRAKEMEACVNELSPCEPFANSITARPTAACCEPLEQVIENQVFCICTILTNYKVIDALDINVTSAITLPQRCGLNTFHLSSDCQGPMTLTEGPSQSPSPSPGGEAGRASNIAWTGSTIMASLLLLANLIY